MKVSELEGADLDCWVAKAEGIKIEIRDSGRPYVVGGGKWVCYAPHRNWSQGGPLIQKYETINKGNLVEAMRELVKRRYGDEVE